VVFFETLELDGAWHHYWLSATGHPIFNSSGAFCLVKNNLQCLFSIKQWNGKPGFFLQMTCPK
jgi:hypothetical protein